MNVIDVFQKSLVYACLAGAAVCFLAVLAYRFRNQLRKLHERWLGLGSLGRVVSILAVTLAVLYGGTKSPTNEVTGTGATGTGATGVSPVAGWGPNGQDARWPSALRPMAGQMAMSPQLTNQPTNQLTNWTARGAFSDWHHIDFPESFAFPHGTNLLTSVTLFAWGEIREEVKVRGEGEQRNCDHHCSPSPSIFTFPAPLSLSPGESSVTYGLTPSNSFLIAWQNACVNRDATNRVDASIELFRSGAILITTQPTNQPTNKLTNYLAPEPPPGFVGNGQDDTWALAAFPDDYDAITNKGYEAWLMEDYVGVNEQNGHVKMAVTINAMPEFGPCYLVCGPHKMIVPESGTYSFPLWVFGEYEVRTYPTDLPIDVEIDDGYSGPEPESPLMQSMSPRRRFASGTASWHKWLILPRLIVDPSSVPYESARNTEITLWKNTDGSEEVSISSFSGLSRMVLTGATSARILRAEINDAFEITLSKDGYSVSNYVAIEPPPLDYHQHSCCSHCCGDYCECNGTCCDCRCDCWGYISNLTNETSRASQP